VDIAAIAGFLTVLLDVKNTTHAFAIGIRAPINFQTGLAQAVPGQKHDMPNDRD